jgi:hypothetical protein
VTGLVEAAYAYRGASGLDRSRSGRPALALATSGGTATDARLFTGTVRRPDLVADGLLAVATVARSRFHVPAAMLARILLAADPIVTVADDRLRFESLSACCGVYARLDLLPDAVDGAAHGRGTTNVDAGPELRAALARIDSASPLGLFIGSASVAVATGAGEVRERRVPLPARWIRGLTEVAAIGPTLECRITLDHAHAVRLLRAAMALPVNRPAWVSGSGRSARIAHHRAPGAMVANGVGRLRILARVLRHLRGLSLYAGPDGSSAWQVDLDGARLTIVLSPEAWRGFSGEGRALAQLAEDRSRRVARVRSELRWQSRVDVDEVCVRVGLGRDEVLGTLALLATSGVVGYDQADAAYFHRELPFDLEQLNRRQPRLADARRLVAEGRVRLEGGADGEAVGWVSGSGVEHRVSLTEAGWACTCPWYARHRGERGPCKHALAVQLLLAGADDA